MLGAYMTPGFPVVSGTVAAAAIGGSTVFAYANHHHQRQKLEIPTETITITGDTERWRTVSDLSQDDDD